VPFLFILVFFIGSAVIGSAVFAAISQAQMTQRRMMGACIFALIMPLFALSLVLYPSWSLRKRALGVPTVAQIMGLVYGNALWSMRRRPRSDYPP
jgi:hypothetical protein